MKMIGLTTAALSAALAMSACAAAPAPVPATQQGGVLLTAERGFAAAELAFSTAANGAGRLADEGALTGATALRVRDWLVQGRAILVKGKAAADTADLLRQTDLLNDLAANLNMVVSATSTGAR